MDKIKAFLIKYKYWVAGGAVALIALYLLRGGGGGSDSGVVQTAYTTSDGGLSNTYSDPTVMLAQLQAQTQLSGQSAQFGHELGLAQIQADIAKMTLQGQNDISLATIDANKWMAQLDSNTQQSIGQLNFDATKLQADTSYLNTQLQTGVQLAEIDANKYIAGRQADIAQYQAKIQKRGQDYAFAGGLLNFAGGFFK